MGYVIDASLTESDVHLSQGCVTCHSGNENAATRDLAHVGLVKRPSDDTDLCGSCHGDIATNYSKSLHFTTVGMKNGVRPRLSATDIKAFDGKVFVQSCNSCHASCGDCHVKGPTVSGISTGLIQGHRFVRKDDAKTCAVCHNGRVYPEFTGEYGGNADVHYQKGMTCTDCHKPAELHGPEASVPGRKALAEKPSCVGCHKPEAAKTDAAKTAHATHAGKASCSACHSSSEYRNCYGCHLGAGATSVPGLILGDNPRKAGQLTTLRHIPTVRDTFAPAGIAQSNYDSLPNYWDAVPHNTKKRTDRTRDCAACHVAQAHFLKESDLPVGGSKSNQALIFKFDK